LDLAVHLAWWVGGELCDLEPIFKLWKLKGIGQYYNVHWDSDIEAIGTAG
jgi:hypothetical protein